MLATRIKTALLLAVPVLLALYLRGPLLAGISLIVFFLMQYEILGFSSGISSARRIGLASLSLSAPVSQFLWGWQVYPYAILVVTTVAFASQCLTTEREIHEDIDLGVIASLALMIAYTVPLGSVLAAEFARHSSSVLLWFVLTVVAADTGAYFAGRAYGKRPLAPRISPKKTVEGAIGGLVAAVLVSLFAERWELLTSYPQAALFAVLIWSLALVGDLVESLIKRTFGLKDSGDILPGHGGILDRVDALIFAAPVLLLL